MSIKTSKDIENFIIKNYHEMTRKELIEKTNVSNSVIRRVIKENNITKKSSKKYIVNDRYFEKIDNEEKAYWLGFLYADGYVRMKINKTQRSGELKLKLKSSDIGHIELFRICLESNHIIKTFTQNVKVDDKNYESECSSISIYNNTIVNDLFSKGCTNRKTFDIKLPDLDDNLMRHFIRGYFDGDGTICIYKNKKNVFNITCGSYNFINKLRDYFIYNIDISKTKLNCYDTYYRIVWTKKEDIKKIYNFLYNNSSIYLNRKKEIFDKIWNI